MSRTLLLGLLVLTALPGWSGEVVILQCPDCGYTSRELFPGSGFIAYSVNMIYSSVEAGEVMLVNFDFIARLARESAESQPKDYSERDDYLETHDAELNRLYDAWDPPAVLGPAAEIPDWITVYPPPGVETVPDDLVLLSNYSSKSYACPVCGGGPLKVKPVGKWD